MRAGAPVNRGTGKGMSIERHTGGRNWTKTKNVTYQTVPKMSLLSYLDLSKLLEFTYLFRHLFYRLKMSKKCLAGKVVMKLLHI